MTTALNFIYELEEAQEIEDHRRSLKESSISYLFASFKD
jgi:hypothetical protein